MATTTRMKIVFCPNCNNKLDAATGEEGKKPKHLDLSICIACGEILMFDELLTPVKMTAEHQKSLEDSGQWEQIVSARDYWMGQRLENVDCGPMQ